MSYNQFIGSDDEIESYPSDSEMINYLTTNTRSSSSSSSSVVIIDTPSCSYPIETTSPEYEDSEYEDSGDERENEYMREQEIYRQQLIKRQQQLIKNIGKEPERFLDDYDPTIDPAHRDHIVIYSSIDPRKIIDPSEKRKQQLELISCYEQKTTFEEWEDIINILQDDPMTDDDFESFMDILKYRTIYQKNFRYEYQ